MAATAVKLTSAMVIKIRTGADAKGNDVYKNITIKKVKPAAAEQDVLEVAQSIGAILGSPVNGIFRQNLDEIVNA